MLKLTINQIKEILSKVEYIIGEVEIYHEYQDGVFTIIQNYEDRVSGMQYILEKHVIEVINSAGFSGSDYKVTEVSDNWYKDQQSYVKVELHIF